MTKLLQTKYTLLFLLLLSLLVYSTIKNIDSFQLLGETPNDMKLNPIDSFCETHLGNSQELEYSCNELTKTNCLLTKCCIYNNNKCVSGDKNGPTYS